MEKTALFLIVFTNVFLVIILGLLTYLIYRLVKQNRAGSDVGGKPEYHPDILKRMKEVQSTKNNKQDWFCPNHPDEPGEANCAICEKVFCKSCIKPYKNLNFCLEHLHFVMIHEWDEVLTLKTSASDPERGVRLYEKKKEILEKMNIPTFIETHYKIDVDHDQIETYLVLFATKERVADLKNTFSEYL